MGSAFGSPMGGGGLKQAPGLEILLLAARHPKRPPFFPYPFFLTPKAGKSKGVPSLTDGCWRWIDCSWRLSSVGRSFRVHRQSEAVGRR